MYTTTSSCSLLAKIVNDGAGLSGIQVDQSSSRLDSFFGFLILPLDQQLVRLTWSGILLSSQAGRGRRWQNLDKIKVGLHLSSTPAPGPSSDSNRIFQKRVAI
ncbi:hypothetical protein MJO28_010707 [Puccinia striiformis f. sp. tritici]|uniref:Uncharacterized protein n=1 Tax=Puccinia striiformis f. sp. tritici TaxID=168172 RepID=A0ACC0E5W6_9BASI|nr:hypothetical protein MJO28_017164 [Puccinia striiformis f. sp. tritici]KAI7945012.1 hypothetical protein MJO28_010707 [Puccinia striiformis f. sp. tritici]